MWIRDRGRSMAIWKGAVKGCIWPEGPHIYKINGYYYLMHAEGGTGPEHSITIARSTELFKWFEGCPRNPIFTHRNLGMDYPVIYAGHGDLVDDINGNWYVVMLASSPCKKQDVYKRQVLECAADERNFCWIHQGKIANIMDNLSGEGRIKGIMIIMADSTISDDIIGNIDVYKRQGLRSDPR